MSDEMKAVESVYTWKNRDGEHCLSRYGDIEGRVWEDEGGRYWKATHGYSQSPADLREILRKMEELEQADAPEPESPQEAELLGGCEWINRGMFVQLMRGGRDGLVVSIEIATGRTWCYETRGLDDAIWAAVTAKRNELRAAKEDGLATTKLEEERREVERLRKVDVVHQARWEEVYGTHTDAPEVIGEDGRYKWKRGGTGCSHYVLLDSEDVEACVVARISMASHNAETGRRINSAEWKMVNDKLAELVAARKDRDLERLKQAAGDATPEGKWWSSYETDLGTWQLVNADGRMVITLYTIDWRYVVFDGTDSGAIIAAVRAQIEYLKALEKCKTA